MPRKKAAPKTAPAVDPAEENDGGIEAYELQKSVVARLCKTALPPDVKLQKEVPTALVKGSTVFISYLAALAHDTAQERNHKTINATHVLDSVKQLGWDDGDELHRVLKKELAAFRAANEARKQGKPLPTSAPSVPKPKPAASTSASGEAMSIDVLAPPAAVEETFALLPDDRPNADEDLHLGGGGEEEEDYPEPAEDEDNTGLEEYVDEEGEELDEAEQMDAASEGGAGEEGEGLGEGVDYQG
ncbi:hypothetical protein JCM8547_008624 [Rhodosporidiobolus lusitaniae]